MHKDGSIWCHIELVGVQTDNFNVIYTPDDETIINKEKIPTSISIGSNMEEDSIINQTETNSRVGSQEAMSHVSSNSSKIKRSSMQTRSMRANAEKKQKALVPHLLQIISPILSVLCFRVMVVFWMESTLEVRFAQSQ